MQLSVIIPTYNEADRIAAHLAYLRHRVRDGHALELVVVDGTSSDGTAAIAAAAHGARVVVAPVARRSVQLNLGARHAGGDVLYFLHADCRPPRDFPARVGAAVRAGVASGCFRLAFRSAPALLRLHSWAVRLPLAWLRFGDQSLYVTRAAFTAVGGFDEQLAIFEDQDMARRLRRTVRFRVLRGRIFASPRAFVSNGIWRTHMAYYLLELWYLLGATQAQLLGRRRRLLGGGRALPRRRRTRRRVARPGRAAGRRTPDAVRPGPAMAHVVQPGGRPVREGGRQVQGAVR